MALWTRAHTGSAKDGYMAKEIFYWLLAFNNALGIGFFSGMISMEFRRWLKRRRSSRILPPLSVLHRIRERGPNAIRGYDSPELFQEDTSLRESRDAERQTGKT